MRKALVVLVFGVAAFALAGIPLGNAQAASSPQFWVTWQAMKSYTPSWYAGKALPGITSPITASFELIANGAPLNIKSKTVYWYLNDNLIASGLGIQHVTFMPYGGAPSSMELRIELPNYNGSLLLHTINIPVAQPKAVIEALYPQNQFSGTVANVQALPFFFSSPANNLQYSWIVNGVPAQSVENPDSAQITLPTGSAGGTVISTALTVANPNDNTTAETLVNLTYGTQL